jgi:hypothetical protein
MMSTKDFQPVKFLRTKDLVNETNFDDICSKINAPVFNGALGLGISTATSVVALVFGGGFLAQRMTARMRYTSPTAQGAENFGVIAGCKNIETTADATYIYGRVQAQVARITRVQDNVFTTLDSAPFVLAPDVDTDIVLTKTWTPVGNVISCTFTAVGGTPGPVTLGAIEVSSDYDKGAMGFRSTSQVMWCKSFTAEQL